MPDRILSATHLNFAQAEAELDGFKDWLDRTPSFTERAVVAELKGRTNLCLLIQLAAGKGRPDRLKHEFALQGAFRADLVVGSTTARHFVLVEFEGGSQNSIFNQRRGSAHFRDWSREVEHAFSQVSDWSWAKNDGQKSELYKAAFGMALMSETYVIICGRDAFLDPTDRARLHWRSEKTMIAACPIRFWTYDDFYVETSAALDVWRALRAERGG